MPVPTWIRVHLAGVGTWSQRDDAPMREGAEVLAGVDALDPAGRALPDIPEPAAADTPDEFGPWLEQAATASPSPTAPPAGAPAVKAATTPGDDDKAGTPTPTGTTSPIKE